MDITQLIDSLAKLLDQNSEKTKILKDFFNVVSKTNVIAGGSIVYTLLHNRDGDAVKPSDIDIFCLNSDINPKNIAKLLHYINEKFHEFNPSYHIFPSELVSSVDPAKNKISVITVKLDGTKIPLQIICSNCSSPMELIESFDLDYVQCAIHSGSLYITNDCKLAHDTKRIGIIADDRVSLKRLDKAINKGFMVPIITNDIMDKTMKQNEILFSDLINRDFSALESEYTNRHLYDDDNIRFRIHQYGLVITDIEADVERSYGIHGLNIQSYNFIILDQKTNKIYARKYVSLDIEIVHSDRSTDKMIRIYTNGDNPELWDSKEENDEDLSPNDTIINNIFGKKYYKTTNDIIETGKYSCIAEAYCLKGKGDKSVNTCLRLVIHKLYPAGGNVHGIKFSEEMDIVKFRLINDVKFERTLPPLQQSGKNMQQNTSSAIASAMYYISLLKNSNSHHDIIKMNAYKCFLYYHVDEKKSLEESMQKACVQLLYDNNKSSDGTYDNNMDAFTFFLHKNDIREIKTTEQMIRYINDGIAPRGNMDNCVLM